MRKFFKYLLDAVHILMTVAIVVVVSIAEFVPNSWWLRVDRIHVFDTTEGTSPKMVVSREISRAFRAEWVVTIKKAKNEGEDSVYYRECSSFGEGDYRPETILPPNLDLDWWTIPIKCNLKPGVYILDTSWKFNALFSDRTVRVLSNVFVVN